MPPSVNFLNQLQAEVAALQQEQWAETRAAEKEKKMQKKITPPMTRLDWACVGGKASEQEHIAAGEEFSAAGHCK